MSSCNSGRAPSRGQSRSLPAPPPQASQLGRPTGSPVTVTHVLNHDYFNHFACRWCSMTRRPRPEGRMIGVRTGSAPFVLQFPPLTARRASSSPGPLIEGRRRRCRSTGQRSISLQASLHQAGGWTPVNATAYYPHCIPAVTTVRNHTAVPAIGTKSSPRNAVHCTITLSANPADVKIILPPPGKYS